MIDRLVAASRRATLALLALLGKFEGVEKLVGEIQRLEEVERSLRNTVMRIHSERQYWYELWFAMGRDFENTQEVLCREIDELSRQLGKNREPRFNEALKQAFKDRFTRPQSHPSPAVQTPLEQVPCPPVVPDGALEGKSVFRSSVIQAQRETGPAATVAAPVQPAGDPALAASDPTEGAQASPKAKRGRQRKSK